MDRIEAPRWMRRGWVPQPVGLQLLHLEFCCSVGAFSPSGALLHMSYLAPAERHLNQDTQD